MGIGTGSGHLLCGAPYLFRGCLLRLGQLRIWEDALSLAFLSIEQCRTTNEIYYSRYIGYAICVFLGRYGDTLADAVRGLAAVAHYIMCLGSSTQ